MPLYAAVMLHRINSRRKRFHSAINMTIVTFKLNLMLHSSISQPVPFREGSHETLRTLTCGNFSRAGRTPTAASKAIDPVCGMQVDPLTTSHHALLAGTDYHFFSARCRERFVADPEKFLYWRNKNAGLSSGVLLNSAIRKSQRQHSVTA